MVQTRRDQRNKQEARLGWDAEIKTTGFVCVVPPLVGGGERIVGWPYGRFLARGPALLPYVRSADIAGASVRRKPRSRREARGHKARRKVRTRCSRRRQDVSAAHIVKPEAAK